MNPDLLKLQAYPFEKLRQLKEGIHPPPAKTHIALSIGEPKHREPAFVVQALVDSLSSLTHYPATKGSEQLRQAIAEWASTRFSLSAGTLTAEQHVLPVNGTREALFAFAQSAVDRSKARPTIVMPNPFYQIYEGAAILAGATPAFIECTAATDYHPNFDAVDESIWQDCQLLFICSPGNPTGSVLSTAQMATLIALADKYDFVIASDECYSELYFDEQSPPAGLLQACRELGRDSYQRCVVFHSLSKRSNLPGLRSGFVAGDAELIQQFLLYRTYHGCAMPVFSQVASTAAWQDNVHVVENRQLYREKFRAVLEILGDCLNVAPPEAGFYLWPQTPISDTEFAQGLFAQENVTVLPGSYLAREVNGFNPGANHVRMALVATLEECVEAAHRIKRFTRTLTC